MHGGGAEREGDTESEADSRLWAISTELDTGLELVNWEIMTWAKVRRLTNWATQGPTTDDTFPTTDDTFSSLSIVAETTVYSLHVVDTQEDYIS